MDLSHLSDEELLAMRKNPLAGVSDQQLLAMRNQAAPDEPGAMRTLAIGAGKGLTDLGQGLQQAYYGLQKAWVNNRGGESPDANAKLAELQAQQQESDRLYAPLKQESPWMTGIGQGFPEMAATVLSGGSASIPAAMLKQGLAAAVPAALSYGSPEERAQRAASTAGQTAIGTGVGGLISRAITPMTKGGMAPNADTLGAVERLGYQLTPGQKLDSQPLMYLERGLSQRTGSAPMFEQLRSANIEALNKGAAADLGETLNPVRNQITPDVLKAARERIGESFSNLVGKTEVKLGTPFLDALTAVDAASRTGLPSLRQAGGGNLIDGVINDALDLAASGKMSGQAYQQTRSALARKTSDAFKANNSDLGRALDGIVTALDDAAGQSMTKTEQAAWQQARKQWSVLKTLETGNVVQAGNVSPALVKGQMQKNYGIPYKEGTMQGPMSDIARLAEGVKALPDSGTPGGIVGMNMTVNPTGLFQTLANTPFRYLLAKSYLSGPGQTWMGNSKVSPEVRRLMMMGGGLLGAAYPDYSQKE